MSKENHPLFLQHLDESQDAVWLIARWLCGRGSAVCINPTKLAPDYETHSDYVDHGDIQIIGEDGMWSRVEVKWLGYQFTGAQDWPHRKFIVCAQHSYDRADPKPVAYFYLNPDATHVAMVVPANTNEHWEVAPYADHRYEGRTQDCYCLDVKYVKFTELPTRRTM